MELVDTLEIFDGETARYISLYHGDLSKIPSSQKVDTLIVSAFANDYTPTLNSLVGSLYSRGLSIADLACDKEYDLRAESGFWLSKPLKPTHKDLNISRIMCFEPETLGSPPEVVGELFRGIFPFLNDEHDTIIAMPIIAAGDQNWSGTLMLLSLLEAASEWLSRGLAIKELKIVEYSHEKLAELSSVFKNFKQERERKKDSPHAAQSLTESYDVFISYSSHDLEAANEICRILKKNRNDINIFDMRLSIDKGKSWQSEIDTAIESCKKIIAVMSQQYFDSVECHEELMIARLRNKRSHGNVLLPIYWKKLNHELALWLQIINYSDCREKDKSLLTDAVSSFAAKL